MGLLYGFRGGVLSYERGTPVEYTAELTRYEDLGQLGQDEPASG